jgi:transposase
VVPEAPARSGADFGRKWQRLAKTLTKPLAIFNPLPFSHGLLVFCYEAGPCGYGVYRQLTSLSHRCDVVAPLLIPTKAGDRVKTNRRDATMLARLHRAGELTPVWVPDADHEAMRDLIRLRSVVRQIVTRARQHLQGFLLRYGRKHGRGTAWRIAYRPRLRSGVVVCMRCVRVRHDGLIQITIIS